MLIIIKETVDNDLNSIVDWKIIILVLSLFFNAYAFYQNYKATSKSNVLQQLATLQEISIDNPYVEDYHFIKHWPDFCFLYKNMNDGYNIKKNENYRRFLIYEQYCEMVFNFISNEFYRNRKTLSKMNKDIDLETWVLIHKGWLSDSLYSTEYGIGFSTDLFDVFNYWVNKQYLIENNKFKTKRLIDILMNRKLSRKILFNPLFNINDFIESKYKSKI